MSNLSDFHYTVGVDIAKKVMQVFCCDPTTGDSTNQAVKREEFLEFFTNRPACYIGMEACGGSQYWAIELEKLGHTVRLMDPKLVKPFVDHNKSDKADAIGIHQALLLGVRAVAVKGPKERDIQTLLKMHEMLVKQRTANVNHVRGLLTEYGEVIPKSLKKFDQMIDESINKLEGNADQLVIDMMRDIVKHIRESCIRITQLVKEINRLVADCKNSAHFKTIPGVGPVITAHMSVLLADPTVFANGRQFAAYLGLVPRHTGSGGKTINLHIPGRCDKRLRALMVEGAQAVAKVKNPLPWVANILAKKPKKVALIAIANRLARQCWAVASSGKDWTPFPKSSVA